MIIFLKKPRTESVRGIFLQRVLYHDCWVSIISINLPDALIMAKWLFVNHLSFWLFRYSLKRLQNNVSIAVRLTNNHNIIDAS